jgi:hypothetical protein
MREKRHASCRERAPCRRERAIERKFPRGGAIYDVQIALAHYVTV